MDYWRANKSADANTGDQKVFYAYDERMKLHEDYDDHPECPARIESIYEHLSENGYLDGVTKLEVVESEVTKREDGSAKYDVIEAVHTRE